MKTRALIFVGVLAFAGVAFAVSEIRVDTIIGNIPQWIQPGLYIGSAAKNPPQNITNKVTGIFGSGLTYVNFGQLDAGCAQSDAITVTGAATGDICLLGNDIRTASNGIPGTNASADCAVTAANAVKVRVCVTPSPTGTAVTVGDAGVNVIVISNQ